MQAIAARPEWAGVLLLTTLVSFASTGALLSTETGQVALLDQWERTAIAFGQPVDDVLYEQLRTASANGIAYAAIAALVGGPVLAFASALALHVVLGLAWGFGGRFVQILGVTAHAGVILSLRQLLAAPLNYARETLSSPATLGVFVRGLEEASPVARFMGMIDLFVVWWAVVLAVGAAIVCRRPVRTVAAGVVGTYVVVALLLVIAMAISGGIA
jgi:hypothetical protein